MINMIGSTNSTDPKPPQPLICFNKIAGAAVVFSPILASINPGLPAASLALLGTAIAADVVWKNISTAKIEDVSKKMRLLNTDI